MKRTGEGLVLADEFAAYEGLVTLYVATGGIAVPAFAIEQYVAGEYIADPYLQTLNDAPIYGVLTSCIQTGCVIRNEVIVPLDGSARQRSMYKPTLKGIEVYRQDLQQQQKEVAAYLGVTVKKVNGFPFFSEKLETADKAQEHLEKAKKPNRSTALV